MNRQALSGFSLVALLLLAGLFGGVLGAGVTWWLLGRQPDAVARQPAAATQVVLSVATPSPSATVTLAPRATSTPTAMPSATPTPVPSPTATASPLPNYADAVAAARRSVVTVINARSEASLGGASAYDLVWGSGVFVDARGYLVTNHHVISGAHELIVELSDGRELWARFVAGDPAQDLALLFVPGASVPAAVWGRSDTLRPGDPVIVIGSPLGNLPNSVTTGVVSGLDRTVALEDNTRFLGMIQTDAAINRGNSGGAMLNLRGELIGVVALIIREMKQEADPDVQGIGFAIPSSTARAAVAEWIAEDAPRRGGPQ